MLEEINKELEKIGLITPWINEKIMECEILLQRTYPDGVIRIETQLGKISIGQDLQNRLLILRDPIRCLTLLEERKTQLLTQLHFLMLEEENG